MYFLNVTYKIKLTSSGQYMKLQMETSLKGERQKLKSKNVSNYEIMCCVYYYNKH